MHPGLYSGLTGLLRQVKGHLPVKNSLDQTPFQNFPELFRRGITQHQYRRFYTRITQGCAFPCPGHSQPFRTASQGSFEINPRDPVADGQSADGSVNKRLRVVTTVTYALK